MITAIGNPVFDIIKTQKTKTDSRVLSGCSVNAALALAKLNYEAQVIGAVGDDFRQTYINKMSEYDAWYWIFQSKESGGFSLEYLDDYGNRNLELLGRASDLTHINPRYYRNSEAVLVGPILGEVSFDELSEIRKNFGGLLCCDPQGFLRNVDENNKIIHQKPEGVENAFKLCNIVKPNELEGEILTGINCRENPYQAAEIIQGWGVKIVIITLAELGSVIYDGVNMFDIPPFETEMVDSTGAGDVYMAGFVIEYLKTNDLRKSGCFASAVSSFMIEQTGPDFRLSENEVRNRQETLLAKQDFRVID